MECGINSGFSGRSLESGCRVRHLLLLLLLRLVIVRFGAKGDQEFAVLVPLDALAPFLILEVGDVAVVFGSAQLADLTLLLALVASRPSLMLWFLDLSRLMLRRLMAARLTARAVLHRGSS